MPTGTLGLTNTLHREEFSPEGSEDERRIQGRAAFSLGGEIINAVLSYDVLGIIINRMIKCLMFFITNLSTCSTLILLVLLYATFMPHKMHVKYWGCLIMMFFTWA